MELLKKLRMHARGTIAARVKSILALARHVLLHAVDHTHNDPPSSLFVLCCYATVAIWQ